MILLRSKVLYLINMGIKFEHTYTTKKFKWFNTSNEEYGFLCLSIPHNYDITLNLRNHQMKLGTIWNNYLGSRTC